MNAIKNLVSVIEMVRLKRVQHDFLQELLDKLGVFRLTEEFGGGTGKKLLKGSWLIGESEYILIYEYKSGNYEYEIQKRK